MIRLNFASNDREAVLNGGLDFTLRPQGRHRQPGVGETVTLATAKGPIATAQVVCRATLILGPTSLLRVTALAKSELGEGLALLLVAAEQAAHAAERHLPYLATRAGFSNWEALYTYQVAKGINQGDRVWRELVGWNPRDLVLAVAAA